MVVELIANKLHVHPPGHPDYVEDTETVREVPLSRTERLKLKSRRRRERESSPDDGPASTESTPVVPASTEGARDLMMWVGYQHYPTIASFVNEASTLGVSKRLSKLPGVVLGETRVFLVHDEGVFTLNDEDQKVNDAAIFGWFTIDWIELLVDDEVEIPDSIETAMVEHEDLITQVPLVEARMDDERGCGWRDDPWSLYLHQDAPVHEIEPVNYNALFGELGSRFRSYKWVDGDAILASTELQATPLQNAPSTLSEGFTETEVAKGRWSDTERAELMRLCAEFGMYKGCKEYARQTLRSFQGAMYQYRQELKKNA